MPRLRLFWDYMNEQTDRIRRVVKALRSHRIRFALVGGHAVSYHWRPRVTVDVDFLVPARALGRLPAILDEAGFIAEKRGEIIRAWDHGMNPAVDEPVVDFVPAEYSAAQAEALRTAKPVKYQGVSLAIVSRAALVALKFLSATSEHRAFGDKAQDIADLAHIVKQAWSAKDALEARRLVELSRPGAARLGRLIDDIIHDRPITI